MPKILSAYHRNAFTYRLAEYVAQSNLTRCAVIFHGGEPLLAGAQALVDFAGQLRKICSIPVDISLQTNGLLLTDEALSILEKSDIGISLSLDGPKSANDKHRLTHKGFSSFSLTEQALLRLQKHPFIFAGVIAVVDASTSAEKLFEYFDQFNIPRLDFLLPDANWLRLPPGRNQNPDLYAQWLVNAFDVWFDRYSHIPLRTFESLLDMCAGLPSNTDAFGFGDVSLLSVETDGSYHDLDVLKVTQDGATKLKGNVSDTQISEVALSPAIEEHRRCLRKEGLAEVCQTCDLVEICGGGSLPHRFGGNGFINPTVYCNEMKRLITHISNRLAEHLFSERTIEVVAPLPATFSLESFERAETSQPYLEWLYDSARVEFTANLRSALQLFSTDPNAEQLCLLKLSDFERVALHPGAIAWSSAVLAQQRGRPLLTVDGQKITASPEYLSLLLLIAVEGIGKGVLDVGRNDFWLRAPFGKAIVFEGDDLTGTGQVLVKQAMEIVRAWRPALAAEILSACSVVQFVRDPTADPCKIVSFSDNAVPGALYVSISQGEGLIDSYDLADSLIHEHRHQKLYLLERHTPTVEHTAIQVVSPWREDLRPPSGLLHAVFVFVELRRFWLHVRDHGPVSLRSRAVNQLADTDLHLKQAFVTLGQCPLTQVGQCLVDVLQHAAMEGKLNEFGDHHSAIPAIG